MDLYDRLRRELRQTPNAMALLDELFVNPYVTVSRAARLLNVSYPTARTAVTRLQKDGLLEEITGRSWGRLYLARPILEAMENKGGSPLRARMRKRQEPARGPLAGSPRR
jgi:hypothetical protein